MVLHRKVHPLLQRRSTKQDCFIVIPIGKEGSRVRKHTDDPSATNPCYGDFPMKSAESRIRNIFLKDIDRSRNHRIPRHGDAERLDAIKQCIEACGQLQLR